MNKEDMSEMIQKLNNMINQSSKDNEYASSDTSSDNAINVETLQNMIAQMNSSQNDNTQNQENNSFQMDFETMMKMKTMIDSFQSAKNSPEANLLLSLKPYLNTHRKQKLDQYMQFIQISKILEAFNSSNGGANEK